jgi:hypothetical protein
MEGAMEAVLEVAVDHLTYWEGAMERVNVLQKLRKMRAALSLSFSRVVGQKASEPSLLLSLLTGGPNLSTRFHALSKPTLPPPLIRDHQLLCWLVILDNPGAWPAPVEG